MPTSPETGNKLKKIRQTAAGFDPAATADKTLAIVFKNDGYCFCVADASAQHVFAVQADLWSDAQLAMHPTERLADLIKNESLTARFYSRVLVGVENNRFVLVPKAVYQDGTGTDYYETVFQRQSDEQLSRDSLNRTEAELIYGLPFGLPAAIQLKFPACKSRSLVSAFTEYLQSHVGNEHTLYIQLRAAHILLWAYSSQKLLLVNSYPYQTNDDILYHCINLRKQLQLDGIVPVLLENGSDMSELQKSLDEQFSQCQSLLLGQTLNESMGLGRLEKAIMADAFTLLCAS